MADTAVIQADPRSALSKYLHLLISIPGELEQRVARDAYALRILEVKSTGQVAPDRRRRVWTRQDERRLKLQQGLVSGLWPRCRAVRYIDQVAPRCKSWFRDAITEARNDGTASALCIKLDAADKAVDAVLSSGRTISQNDGGEPAFTRACLVLREVAGELIHWTKPTPVNSGAAVVSGVANRDERKLVWLAEALLSIRDHPDWSDAEIARLVGKSPSTLSRNQTYQMAAKMARGNKSDRHRGHITADPETGQQGVEGYAEDPEEPEWDE